MTLSADAKLGAGLAGLVLLGLVAGVWPNLRGSARLDREIADLSSRVERSDDGAAALDRLRETLAERRAEAGERLKPIPKDEDVGGIIRAMSTRFTDLGLGRPEIKTGRPVEQDEAKSLPMTIEIRGEFLQLMQAVGWVESLERLVRVRKIRIETPTGQGAAPLFGEPLKGEIVLDVYYEPALTPPTGEALAEAGEGE